MKKVKPVLSKDCKIITAKYDDYAEFVLDSFGYFLIRVDYKKKLLEVGLCKEDNVIITLVKGKNPLEIYKTVINNHLVTRKDHCAYLGRELQKALTCLNQKVIYVQDSPIDFSKKISEKKEFS